MTTKELYVLVEEYFGYKIRKQYMDSRKKEVCGTLYDSFFFSCNINDRYGRFGAGICFAEQEHTITEFLGKTCSLNCDEKSIKNSLKIIDDYCRLRLPDKFLDAYDDAYLDT